MQVLSKRMRDLGKRMRDLGKRVQDFGSRIEGFGNRVEVLPHPLKGFRDPIKDFPRVKGFHSGVSSGIPVVILCCSNGSASERQPIMLLTPSLPPLKIFSS